MKKFSITLLVSLISCTFYYVNDCQAKSTENLSNSMSNSENLNDADAMSRCNETFRIKPEYIQELNDTGSFPDESEKTPMCYIKCYLEAVGILSSENTINKEKACMMFQLDSEEVSDECTKEMTSAAVTDECEKAYFYIRCIMSRSLLDRLGEDNDEQK